ncbi:MAG: hypothetical protein PV347_05300, partial [Rickettsiaceae bacterium]|nr:hypothetical protein [Rickettsiaceae bacterium]MDD9337985.1 hypothetical protein [Rickettsiaceae bacterium]
AAYTDVREERRRVSTTKSPTRLTYAVSLLYQTHKRLLARSHFSGNEAINDEIWVASSTFGLLAMTA